MIIYIIDDDTMIGEYLYEAFEKDGHVAVLAQCPEDMILWETEQAAESVAIIPDVVVMDYDFGMWSRVNGVDALDLWWPYVQHKIIFSGLDRDVPEGIKCIGNKSIVDLVNHVRSL
jgi:DNA-binding response OmpR family regulator